MTPIAKHHKEMLASMSRPQLEWFLEAYDSYVQEANNKDSYESGWRPVCIDEFWDCEFAQIIDEDEDLAKEWAKLAKKK